MTKMDIQQLGQVSYDAGLELMMRLHEQRQNEEIPDTILVLQHDAVITKGRRLHGHKIPFQDQIEQQGIQVRDADRGGKLTYHGPGQIVVYFILKFETYYNGVADLVHGIESSLLTFLKHEFGILGNVDADHPGIWVNGKKIASIGLRVSNSVTRHGISLNISNDLSVYKLFDPCGMSGESMTNVRDILNDSNIQSRLDDIQIKIGLFFQDRFIEKAKAA